MKKTEKKKYLIFSLFSIFKVLVGAANKCLNLFLFWGFKKLNIRSNYKYGKIDKKKCCC